ncbi:MAG: ATP-binding protein [Candidatus Omnitrophica bacterium]|nr:ATP-binding protein [Candidatus Omnitrophota bacterium]MDD5488701.1 ATP-binding protein [Candidatus Omnitrophota bacterium]
MIKAILKNDVAMLKDISRQLVEELKNMKVKEEIVFDVRLAFEEALRNAMIHGNRLDPGKKVKVEADMREQYVVISIEDEGSGFDPDSLPDPTLERNLLREGGRGVFLIKKLMDEVIYENNGKKVRMVKMFCDKNEGRRVLCR